jgi:hypothetical protein
MLKKTYFVVSLLFLSLLHFQLPAQQSVPDADFENWAASSLGPFEEPASGWWISLNFLSNLTAPVTVSKTTDAKSGQYAARLESKMWGEMLIPGLLVSGSKHPNPPSFTDMILQGRPFTGKPNKIKGYYKFFPVAGDSCAFYAKLSRWNSLTQKQDTIATAAFSAHSEVAGYERFELVFTYNSNLAPDSLTLLMISSSAGKDFLGQAGTTLIVDEIEVEYETGVNHPESLPEMLVFPSPARDLFFIRLPGGVAFPAFVNVFSPTGQWMVSQKLTEGQAVDIRGLQPGLYFLQVAAKRGERYSGKLQIMN